jgi:hypothetical protein
MKILWVTLNGFDLIHASASEPIPRNCTSTTVNDEIPLKTRGQEIAEITLGPSGT